ncbi:MAG TPA: hypothetical protein PLS90_02935 [Candidatus Sumerlaeota bacterium]|nr:hypothetical protein [Candidatus Sumerlaeota bacterium]HOR28830.1 hypothetical protein [Candidatus Sumerlaeota bacterium]HPK01391.1 hypothetical protein [Candidatus Sumerlaeota bacterium]
MNARTILRRKIFATLGCLLTLGFSLLLALRPAAGLPGTLFANPVWAQDDPAPLIDPAREGLLAGEDATTTATQGWGTAGDAPFPLFASDPLHTLADSLRARERELERREREVAEAEQRLETVRLEIEQNLRRTEEVLAEMRRVAGEADQRREAELKKWIQIYQGMKPDKAGPMIGALEPQFQLDLLSRMDTRKAGKILESMDPQKAKSLALELAARQ